MGYDIPRGRSPSQGHSNHISPQPSPHQYQNASTKLGPGPAVNNSVFIAGEFAQGGTPSSIHYHPTYPEFPLQAQTLPQTTTGRDSTLDQSSDFCLGAFQNTESLSFEDTQTFDNPFLQNNTAFFFADGDTNLRGDFSDNNLALDPPFDPTQQPNINPATLSKMPPSNTSTPPNLLPPENHSSPGHPGSPTSTKGQFYTPQHSRHQSLDPASAAYRAGPGLTDWQGVAFQQHRRAASDQSEISSNAPSPFLPHAELGDSMENGHSPMMSAQQDGLNAFGIENFSINDHQQAQVSPGHSPYISPQLTPQPNQGLGMGPDLMLQQGMQNHIPGAGPEIYTTQPEESFASMSHLRARHTSVVSDMGQADQFPAPIINIEPAPVSRQASFEHESNNLGDNLSPPARPRGRSKSDPHVSKTNSRPISRSTSPAGRSPSPSLGTLSEDGSVRSLSPGLGPPSRESSPGPVSGRIEKSRRQSTSSIPTRDYILDLADPSRPSAAPSHASARAQKHPATFQCTLCPKRFTRAYNLRSHLRTHTDERPFVCTVCSKAFARQHDRKRHEGLHSGEKKFVCKGELGSGENWGCSRKFARADALGRHFRSEAGRICIKPLLDEEAAERARSAMLEQQRQAQFTPGALDPVQHPMMINLDVASGGSFALPAALLAQYPALGNIDWSTMPQGDDAGDLSDVGMARNGLDVGNGGDFGYDENEIDEGYVRNNGMGYASSSVQGAW